MKDKNVWNTICPVCGANIPPDMALIDLAHVVSEGHYHEDEAQEGLRFCSARCAQIAEKSPRKYRMAAADSRVVGGEKRTLEAPPGTKIS